MNTKIGEIALTFFSFRDQLKIYHWQTGLYSRHKSSDELVEFISDKMDQFIEIIQGSKNVRVKMPHSYIPIDNHNDNSIVELCRNFNKWLTDTLPLYLDPKDTDLFNIRDEILGKVNQILYLFTFK